ncbi:hypothetical protein FNV43_RR16523 [Rhamnella rubrinervis]|uniref:3,9-dihydroxypterocarpan 6A-monooxygenase n=1 Tax=Rhamnella rubrinervis TaxID=2594499 RepID=A0A8K0GYX7_9ROSA|nr:hypothetical protein FNV43_RR16523 [Rhamnella rubrinervis]
MFDLQYNFVLLLIWLASMIIIRTIFSKTRTKATHRLPPSPQALPIIGHLHLLCRNPQQALNKLSNRYGPLIYLLFGSQPSVIVSSAEVAKECLKTNENCFLNRPKMTNLDYLTYGSADFTMTPYGPKWKLMKKLCMAELLGGRTMELHLPLRREETKRFLKSMLRKAEKCEKVDVGAELIRLTNNIISMMALKQRCSEDDDEAQEVRKLVKDMCELARGFNISDMIWFCKKLDLQGYGKKLKHARDGYDKMMEKIMKEHEEARKKRKQSGGDDEFVKDFLDILLEIYEDQSSEIRLTRENVKAFIMNMFGAGTDSTAVTIEWALLELINHPNVMAKARREIDSKVGHNRIVEESDTSKLPYLQAIVKETLRLHPTAPMIMRESTEDCTINGYHIPAKTQLFVNVWSIGRDPNHWENPLEFQPERFTGEEGNIRKSDKLDVKGQNFHYLPFGSGRRSCPGASLAMEVVQTILGGMIQCFEWKVWEEGVGRAVVNMEEGPGISSPTAPPLVCVPVSRLSPSVLNGSV